MTREEFETKWNSLTPEERDAWVAEVMDFKPRIIKNYLKTKGDPSYFKCYRPYTEDISSAMEVEEKVIEITEPSIYATFLADVIALTKGLDNVSQFDLIHATPEQRCKAALICKVVE